MSIILRVLALASCAWAVLLLGVKDHVIDAAQLTPLTRAYANGLGIASLVLAAVFWDAARAPNARRGAVYSAIAFLTLKMSNNLYEILILLPPSQALFSVVDLVVNVALLVAMLEALPRTFAARAE